MRAESPKLYHLKQRRDTGRGVKAAHKERRFWGEGAERLSPEGLEHQGCLECDSTQTEQDLRN